MNYINHKPIYLQIAYDIILKIKNKTIEKATLLPSVRELSLQYEVTPKTIQSVTKYLSEINVIKIKPGVGSVVTNDDEIIIEAHNSYAKSLTKEFIESMHQIHITNSQIKEILDSSLKEDTHD